MGGQRGVPLRSRNSSTQREPRQEMTSRKKKIGSGRTDNARLDGERWYVGARGWEWGRLGDARKITQRLVEETVVLGLGIPGTERGRRGGGRGGGGEGGRERRDQA